MPIIYAPPFVLRPFKVSDLALIKEAATDPLIPLITTVPANYSEAEGLKFIKRQQGRVAEGIGYSFAIADSVTDQAVGSIGLWLHDMDQGRASPGYWVVVSQRGRNAGAIALGEITRWALDVLKIPRLELYVEPWNIASITVAERSGFQREGLLRSWQQVGEERRDMYVYSTVAALGNPAKLRRRPSARVFVIEDQKRILLLKFVFSQGALAGKIFWCTPGGEVNASQGEKFEAAAQRELFEETGIVMEKVGRHIAERNFVMMLPDGERVFAQEKFFVLKTKNAKLSALHRTEEEHQLIVEHKWWTAAELLASTEAIFPLKLLEILESNGLVEPVTV